MLLKLLNPPRRLARWPLKAALLGVVLLFTLYPNPLLLIRHARHWSDLGALVDPDEPAIAPLVEESRGRIAADPAAKADPRRSLKIVEQVVYEHVRYAWDWETWGCADYLPTAAETLRRGCEDCDGRAVVAASILRKLGHDAQLVTDGSHMWVRTTDGETLSPMPTFSGRTLITTSTVGTRVDPMAIFGGPSLLIDWPKNLGFAAAVFPLGRVMVIAASVLLVCMPARPKLTRICLSLALAACGLLAWRMMCSDPWNNSLGGAWAGIGLSGLAIMTASGCVPIAKARGGSPQLQAANCQSGKA